MKNETSIEGEAHNSVASSRKDNGGRKWLRPRGLLHAPKNAASPGSRLIMLNPISSKLEEDD